MPDPHQEMPDYIKAGIRTMVKSETASHTATLNELTGAVKAAVLELGARTLALEQHAVGSQSFEGGSASASSGRSVSGALLKAMESDPDSFNHIKAWNQGTARADLNGLNIKAALVNESYDPSGSGNATFPSQPERNGIVAPVIAQPRLLNFLRSRRVAGDSVEFVQLNTSDDVDYQFGEGTEKAELEFNGTKRRAGIQTIAGHTTASRQVLSDNQTLAQHIDGVLRAKLMNKLCYEIINGEGSNSDDLRIEGLLKQGTRLELTTTVFADMVGEAIMRQSNLGFQPGLVVVNPATWFSEISTAKTENEKAYLFGSPSSPIPPALWNIPVALEPSLPKGCALVLDLNHIAVLDRERPSVLLSNSHKDYFTRNLVSILGELRAGLEILDKSSVMIVGQEVTEG